MKLRTKGKMSLINYSLDFLSLLLVCAQKASNFAVLSELAQYPLVLSAFVSCINVWLHIWQSYDNSLVNKAYPEQCNNSHSQWLDFVQETFM